MSDSTSTRYRVEDAHERLDDHAESLEHHDRRISQNENWRLQAQGALKIIALILGAGGLGLALDALLSLS